MLNFAAMIAVSTTLLAGTAAAEEAKPTIVLMHGAFADSSSWNGVVNHLRKDGYKTITVANMLRSVSTDASYVSDILANIEGPVVLVGHSYGGQVISNVVNKRNNVKSLVYVAAFAPDTGEAAADLAGKFPGGTLGEALAPPGKLAGGGIDLHIDQAEFHDRFAHDLSAEDAALMAVTQRPITEAALAEKSRDPAWKSRPSYFV